MLLFSLVVSRLHSSRADIRGQATAEYGVVLLVAVALGMAVLMLFTGNAFDGVLQSLLKKVLQTASGMIHA
jgi:hypothetical protein